MSLRETYGPLRRVVRSYINEHGAEREELECGHHLGRRQDGFGQTNAARRRCPHCRDGIQPVTAATLPRLVAETAGRVRYEPRPYTSNGDMDEQGRRDPNDVWFQAHPGRAWHAAVLLGDGTSVAAACGVQRPVLMFLYGHSAEISDEYPPEDAPKCQRQACRLAFGLG
jgi:hypothetical protein